MIRDTLFLDLSGTFFFALSGSLIARNYGKLDSYGIAVVALLTAVGGGTVRDILLNAHPIAWIDHPSYMIAIILGIISARSLQKWGIPKHRFMQWIDPVAVSFAAIAGLQKSLEFGANPITAIFLGVVTATFGGVLRDVICNEIPKVFASELYASIVLAGLMLNRFLHIIVPNDLYIPNSITMVFIVSTRLYTKQRNLHLHNLRMILQLLPDYLKKRLFRRFSASFLLRRKKGDGAAG